MNPESAAASVQWRIEPFIDGRYRASAAEVQADNINPATEKTLCHLSVGHVADVDAAVRVARQRYNEGCWADLPATRRGDILCALADLVVNHKAELALLDTLEMGKPTGAALFDAEHLAPMVLRAGAGYANKLFGRSIAPSSRMMSFNVYEPRGVIGAIIPWNFPLANAAIKIAPALAAGNSLVLKPSELTASSALRLAELALEAGVPAGVLNVIPGLGSTSALLLRYIPTSICSRSRGPLRRGASSWSSRANRMASP
jgi:acyl-CoA reductase-like NAD-dependent aldehyde dehydrogenase